MDSSPKRSLPPYADAYFDVEGQIDADIYNFAGELWPQAAALARNTINDEAAGQMALARVCARITSARSSGGTQISSLKAYIFRSYKHEIVRLLKIRRLHDLLTANYYEVINESRRDTDVDRKILIEQILARMDAPNREVFELLVLGYSFEKIAKDKGKRSNVIRSAFSKQLQKIRRELSD
jgi:DNA-directed RNA polymerase specialized sigma24 family protein